MPAKPSVFISHIQEELALAEYLQTCVLDDFLGMVDAFVDKTSISGGADWLQALRGALDAANLQVILCSPVSVARPWVNFEAGAAWLKGIRIFPLCHGGLNMRDLPMPLSLHQGGRTTDPDTFQNLYKSIAELAGLRTPRADFKKLASQAPVVSIAAPVVEAAPAPIPPDTLLNKASAGDLRAIAALGASGAPEAFETLERILDAAPDPGVWMAAQDALLRLDKARMKEALSKQVLRSYGEYARLSAQALARDRDAASIPILVRGLATNPNSVAGWACAQALTEYAPKYPDLICPALADGLHRVGDAADPCHRGLQLYESAAIPFLLPLLVPTENKYVLLRTIDILRVIGDPAAIAPLRALSVRLPSNTDAEEVRAAIERALRAVDPKIAVADAS